MSGELPRISPAIARKLGYYVYLYVDPVENKVIYVGKGKNGRVLSHLRADERRALTRAIRRIKAAGQQPRIEILAHGLQNEAVALKVEAAAIDLLGVQTLANEVRGHGAKSGRMPLSELIAHYTRRKANIKESCILIRINKLYHYGMTPEQLYDATRSAWRVGPKRDDAQYAFSVFEGVVREVYRITQWLPAGSTFNSRYRGKRTHRSGRWEFVGTLAEESVRKRYIDRYVGHLFNAGAQNPVSYINPKR